ncbi:MAG: ATP-binding protein [Myxococcota bacterium]|nr:ATP-binding protein [Myxococcota bacterium]
MSRADLLAVAEGRAQTAGYRLFDRSNGMRSAETNGTTQPAGTRTRDGHLWFPTLRGAVTFDPADPRLERPAPTPTIDAVQTGDGRRLPPTSDLSFPPSVRGLEFHFGALDFDDAEQLRFRYRLWGHDQDWVEAGTRRGAHYANLRPGDYRFEVQVTRSGEPYSDHRASAPVSFQFHWWESLWFYALAAGLGTALTAGFYLLRVGRLKSHERELEARVAERTSALERANGELDEHLRTLRQTQAQLVEAGKLAAVGTLAAGVGHEINNPLAYIVSNLNFARMEIDALERAATPAQRQEAVAEVQQALEESLQGADRVRRIVQDLKTFSRKEEEEEEEELPGPVDLHQVLDSAAKLASGELRHRARVTRHYGNVPKVEANPGRLGQVFLNLLINAAHAIPEKHASSHEVLLTTRQEGSWAVVEIKDSGAGMPPAVLARIFEPFFTTKPVGVGTGLGLSLCRTYLTSMGATLEAESAPGRGSTFRLRLKLAGLEDAPLPEPVSAPSSPGAAGRLLVIDDDPLVVSALTRILRDQHQVDSQSSARGALALLTGPELPYHVVLCDLMMPEMTGMELHAELTRTHPERASQLVFITGGAFTEQSREFLERVDNLRMEKPFQLDLLRELIALRVAAAQQSRRAA